MTTHVTPIVTWIRRGMLTFAVANVLGFASANASTITMLPLHTPRAQTHGPVTTCGSADRDAAITGPAFVEYPAIAQMQGVGGETLVRVDLSSAGNLRGVSLDQSSGNRWLDGAALAVARTIRFTPEIANCLPVAGSYALSVRFGTEE